MAASEGRKKFFWFVVYVLWIVFDVEALWGISHILSISAAVFGTICLAFAEFNSIPLGVGLSAAAVLAGVIFYEFAPLAPPQTGWLQAADVPTPPNGCDSVPAGAPSTADGIVVLFGNNAMLSLQDSKFVVITVETCPMLSISIEQNGAVIDADINDTNGKHLGSIIKNKFTLTSEVPLSIERSGDLSSLIVHNDAGVELLYVRYLNPKAFRVRGIFTCAKPRLVTGRISNRGIENSMFSNSCFAGGSGGVLIQ